MSIERARQMRKDMPKAEAAMWSYLKTLRSDGFHFRRQVPLGRYYADFACHHAKLVIEVDGDTHYTTEGIAHDQNRDRFISSIGFRIVRYTNTDILQNMEGVALHLLNLLATLPLRPGLADNSADTAP
jgi:very-short-patch-repair endonuclease